MSNPTETPRPVAVLVPEDGREAFLPTLFGNDHFFVAENTLYNLMSWLSPQDYGGGFWTFYALDGVPLYMVPPALERYRLTCETNGYSGEVSPDAAGIIVTLFTFSFLSFRFDSDHLSEGFHRLREYAYDHPEASAIFAAID